MLNRVDRTIPDSPAEKAGIQPGQTIQTATISLAEKIRTQEKIKQPDITIDFDSKNPNWPVFFYTMQKVHPDSTVELKLDNDRTVKLNMVDAAGWFNPDRGFIFESESFPVKAQSLAQAVNLGADETWGSLTMVVRILSKLGTQVSAKELAGPIGIATIAGKATEQGPASLLLFLTLLSANLAVLNLLPIPVLDGGHLIFLAYEGIRGKPADERVQVGLSLLGLAFLVGLMIFVTRERYCQIVF